MILDPQNRELAELHGPFFRPWTFRVLQGEQEVGRITKQWSGLLREAFPAVKQATVLWNPQRADNLRLGGGLRIMGSYFTHEGSSVATPNAEGTGPLYFADLASGREVSVAIAGNTIAVRRGCPALTFTGLWGQAGTTPARYFGSAVPGGSAALTVDRETSLVSASPNAVSIALRDRSGTLLLGPLVLRPVSGPVAPLPCP